MNELLGHGRGQGRAVSLTDIGQHHVGGRHTAGTGKASITGFVERFNGRDRRKTLAKRRQALPMKGDDLTIQQAGLGQRETSGIDSAQGRCLSIKPGQPAI